MKHQHEPSLPEDLKRVASKLEENRADINPLTLDQVKQRALARASRRGRRGSFLKTRLATIVTAVALLGGSGAAVALSSFDSHPNVYGGAAAAQYKKHHRHCYKGHGKHNGVCHKKHHRHHCRKRHGKHKGVCHKKHHHVHHPPGGKKDSDGDFDGDLTRAISLIGASQSF